MSDEIKPSLLRSLKEYLSDVAKFSEHFIGIVLRPYQVAAARAIVDSVLHRDGETFIIIFARQSGKDEMLAIIIIYLLFRLFEMNANFVMANPTFKPQTITAMHRLRARTQLPFFQNVKSTAGYIFRHFTSRITYLSAHKTANSVSVTADRLLIANEAQHITPAIWDERFGPMGASGDPTRVFCGTRWTKHTLLERELRIAQQREKKDRKRRVFIVDGTEVARSNKFYKSFLKKEVEKLGRQHPLIKTQYFCETIDAQAGLFNERRRALMIGDQPAQDAPIPGRTYAFVIDVAGQDEAHLELDGMGNPGRDSVTLNIVDVDLSTLELLLAPTYRVVKRLSWQGEKHTKLFGQIKALAETWSMHRMLIDATGVGEGLWAMFDKAFPTRVIPIYFTGVKKSEIGYRFIGVIETGRFRDCAPSDEVRIQYEHCYSEILPGPQKQMRWGVPDGTRDENNQLVHDDFCITDAMTSELDTLPWFVHSETKIIEGADVLKEMDGNY